MNRVKAEHPSPNGATPSPGPSPSPAPSPAPTGAYTDFLLRSVAPSSETGWRYNLMKFSALGDRVVDPAAPEQFVQPVKLNRKDPRTVRRLTEEDRERINRRSVAHAAGLDAMDVDDGADGADVKPAKRVREEMDLSLVGTGKSGLAPAMRTKSNMFKKKTKRVFVSSEEARRLKREEWMPWVLEDDNGDERWVGTLEGGAGEAVPPKGAPAATKRAAADANGTGNTGWRPEAATVESGGGGSSYVAFVFGDGGADFSIVPLHRWYKFSRGLKYATLGTEEAEDEYNRAQKSQDAEGRWMMHKRLNTASQQAAAAAAASGALAPGTSAPAPAAPASARAVRPTNSRQAAAVPTGANIRSRLLDKSVLSGRRVSNAGGGAGKLRTVNRSSGGNDDDELNGRRSKGEGGGEQGDDEFDYEEDFQDDEEGIAKIDDMADEEETKELEERIKKEMRAARHFEEAVPDDDDDVVAELTNTGKEVKKLVRKGNAAYDSDGDDDENPYNTDYETDDSMGELDLTAATDALGSSGPSLQRSASQQGPRPSSTSGRHQSTSRHTSRPGSRSGSPNPSGSTLVAMRATSPSGGRKSLPGSRGVSPGPGVKRKRPDDEADGGKRRKNASPSPGPSNAGGDENLLTEADVVALLKTKAVFTTKEVLSHFKKAFKLQPKNKALIGGLLQAVANLMDGSLQLKPGY